MLKLRSLLKDLTKIGTGPESRKRQLNAIAPHIASQGSCSNEGSKKGCMSKHERMQSRSSNNLGTEAWCFDSQLTTAYSNNVGT